MMTEETAPQGEPQGEVASPEVSNVDTGREPQDTSLDAIIDRAFNKVEQAERAAQPRSESGKFASTKPAAEPAAEQAKEPAKAEAVEDKAAEKPAQEPDTKPASPPPSRFSADAKAAWEQAPEPVRAETERALRELENGLKSYQDRFAPLKPFEELAQQYGTTIPKALENYVGIERLLQADPIAGFELVAKNIGKDFAEVCRQYLAGDAQQQAQPVQADREARQEIARLRQELTNLQSWKEANEGAQLERHIADFSKDRPRFEELRAEMAFFLETGRAANLEQAYTLADRINPAPAAPPPPSPPALSPVQTRKGQLSLTGAPPSGSSPDQTRRSASLDEAINSAFSRAGL